MKYKPTITQSHLRTIQIGASSETDVLCAEIKRCWKEIRKLEKQLVETQEWGDYWRKFGQEVE